MSLVPPLCGNLWIHHDCSSHARAESAGYARVQGALMGDWRSAQSPSESSTPMPSRMTLPDLP
jgi:hypothetical protein